MARRETSKTTQLSAEEAEQAVAEDIADKKGCLYFILSPLIEWIIRRQEKKANSGIGF